MSSFSSVRRARGTNSRRLENREPTGNERSQHNSGGSNSIIVNARKFPRDDKINQGENPIARLGAPTGSASAASSYTLLREYKIVHGLHFREAFRARVFLLLLFFFSRLARRQKETNKLKRSNFFFNLKHSSRYLYGYLKLET